MSFRIKTGGSTKRTQSFLKRMQSREMYSRLSSLAQEGVNALSSATPYHTGLAASSWAYRIYYDADKVTISWTNDDIENGFPVAIMLQYGYVTGTGGYVAGYDYINPALRPIFNRILDSVWKEVVLA